MADLLSEIKAVTKDFMERFASGDMKRLSEIYTVDCRFMPAGQDTIIGREGVAEYFTKLYQSGVTRLNVITDEVGPLGSASSDGTAIYERVHFTFYNKDGSVFKDGKYVVVWKKENGTWLAYIDIWNSNN